MSTRIRMILLHGGRYSSGYEARTTLNKLLGNYALFGPRVRSLDEIKKNFQEVVQTFYKDRLWIFREPRRLKKERSQYKLLADYCGCGARIGQRAARPILGEGDLRMAGLLAPLQPRIAPFFREAAPEIPQENRINWVAPVAEAAVEPGWPRRQVVDGRIMQQDRPAAFWHRIDGGQ